MKGPTQHFVVKEARVKPGMDQGGRVQASFRITGACADRRIRPLLSRLNHVVEWQEATDTATEIDFVWETHVPREWKDIHAAAKVLNRLCNSAILENKAHLAVLQAYMRIPTLETFLLRGSELRDWVRHRWSGNEGDGTGQSIAAAQEWWMLKATGANGGMDVFVLHAGVAAEVLERVQSKELYVLQRYIHNPLLFNGRKFHFRCYALLRGDLRPYLWRRAYILAATNPYSLNDSAELTHLTNLSVNKHAACYPGEIPCNLPEAYPQAFERMKGVWAETIRAAAPFMAVQVSRSHFEFFGLDFIVDTTGHAWLLEVNRLPGLTSSKQNKEEEDIFFDAVITDVLRLCVLGPLTGQDEEPGDFEAVQPPEGVVVEGCRAGEAWKNVLRFGMASRQTIQRLGRLGCLGGVQQHHLSMVSTESAAHVVS